MHEGDTVTTDMLDVLPLIKNPGYHLDMEDPNIYSDDEYYGKEHQTSDRWKCQNNSINNME